MLTHRTARQILLLFALAAAARHAEAQCSGELCPGKIWNPPALQWDQKALYIPTRDEYFIATTEWAFPVGGVVGRFADPDGVLTGSVTTLLAGGSGGVTNISMAYNPDRDEILMVSRDAGPTTVRALYLGSDGQPISTPIGLGSGDAPSIAYSPDSQRYLVTWSRRISGINFTFYMVLDGDSSNPSPILGSGTVDSGGLSDVVAYSTTSQKFLVAYTKDTNGEADVYGRFFSATGTPGAIFAIDASGGSAQQLPQIAYAASTDRFMVVYEDWSSGGPFSANTKGRLITPSGAITAETLLAATFDWDTPGPIGYNAATETFVATWRTASATTHLAQEFRPTDGSAKGSTVLISPFNIGLRSLATRPDAADPQAFILWWKDFDSVYAGIMHLPPAPPQIQPPMPQGFVGVAYSGQIPVAGGTPPLSYEVVSGVGNLPAGLAPAADFATSGIIEGVPTALGTSAAFRVRVTDDDAREDEEDLTLDIALAVPTPISPSVAVNLVQPTFEWGASPGATSYNLVIENVTDGGVVLDQSGITHVFPITTITPSVTLVSGKTYRWRVRASNGAVFSGFSANTDFEVDTTAPIVSNLTAAHPAAFAETPVTAIDSSGEFSASFSKEKVTDGSLVSHWLAPVRSVLTTEFITVDLGSEKTIGQVRLGSRDVTAATFPVDFQVQVSTDGASFSTVLGVTAFAATANTLHPFPFSAINARYVKILITKVNPYSDGNYYTQLSEVKVDEVAPGPNALNISWTAPGDDGAIGQAAGYDLRWSLSPISDLNFGSANVVPNVPSPSPAGTPEMVLFSSLQTETPYYFALKASDDAGNVSPISNIAIGVTTGTPPSPITDLTASNEQLTNIQLNWTAPGDDGIVGTAFAYVVRYSTSPITEENFSSATQVVTGVPSPAIAGTPQNATVTGLVSTTSYYFAIRTFDEQGNTSFSNVLMASTLDDTPPAAVADLAGTPGAAVPTVIPATAIAASDELAPSFGKEKTTDGDSVTFWTTNGSSVPQTEFITWDVGSTKSLMRLRLQARNVASLFPEDYQIRVSTDGATFIPILSVTGASPLPGAWITHDFLPVNTRYIQLWISKARQYVDDTYYVQMAEAQVFEAQVAADAVTLSWTAPGDDGVIGTADMYDVRRSLFPIDTGNFDSATPVPASAPQPAGSMENLAINGLTEETRYYVALKTKDEVPNTSAISNVITIDTPGTPPAAITTLAASNPTGTSVRLDWVATGDDGLLGQASSYEFRYSTSVITQANSASATLVTAGVPSPAASGTPQNMTVTGLSNETMYYFAMLAKDELDNPSAISNVVSATTLDVIAPAAVSDLLATAGGFSYTPLVVTALGSSGDLAASVSKEKATDGNVVTFWSSVGRLIPQEEYLTVDTGSVRMLGRVHLTSRNVANLFPEDFDIQISTDDVSYVTVASETGFVSTPGTPYTFVFSPATARYVKLRVTKARQYVDGTYYVQVAEMSVDEVTSQADQVTLGWTSPGDDGTVGTASSYELRYSTSPINAGNFPSAMLVAGVSAPQVAGSAETHVLTGLSAETLYYFALKTKDEAPNESGLSNVSQVQTVPVPPAAVSDLAASGATTSSVDLDWTATGDDGLVGQATSYEVRYSTSPLTDENFGSATLVVSGVPSPSPSGQAESMTVGSLSASMPYYFGLKVHDDASGVSLLSNVVMKETLDNIVPSTVTDLSGGMGGSLVKPVLVATASSGDLAASVSKEKAVDGSATTFWSSVGTSTPQVEFLTVDTGSVRDLRQVDLIARNVANLFPEDFEVQVSENGVDYTTVVSETGHVAAPGSRSSFVFSSVFGRYVRLRVTKARQYVDGGYYVQFAELEVYEFQSQSGSVLLSWTAPGDDGSVGQATSYDVRYSQSLITAGNFGSAPEAVGEPSPSVAGSAESFLVTGLSAETGYYFALKTTDDSTNTSGISNVVLSYTPGTPPSSVTDLVASNPTNTTVDLDWTSTGDDGLVGTASSYELRYSTSPVTAGNFSGAMLVGSPPVPSVSGSPETKTVGGLTPGETYYFALKVVDEAGNKSGLSNVVTGTTVDDIAPSTVTDLGLSLGSVILQNVPSVGVGASGELLPVTNVTDGSLITIWSSLGSAVQREEFVTVDMGGMHLLGRVRLRSRTVAPELFPEDVVVEVSADNVSFTPVHTATGLGIQASTWFTLDMGTPTLGRYVRIRVTKMRPYAPDNRFYAQIAEVETLESVTSVNVSWTAPGDDGSVGTASSYDLRYSTSPITAGNFAAATPVAGVPAPSVAGSAEAHTVGVLGGSTYYFALKSTDDDSNTSAISNVPFIVVP